MTGYMTKLIGNLYEGELVNGAAAAVPNGILMVQDGDNLELPGAADTDTKFVCKEVGSIFNGVTAYRFIVDAMAKRYYFVENAQDINDSLAYDKRDYTTPVGGLLRAHPLQVGEEFWTNNVTGTPAKDSTYTVKADGTIG